MVQRAAALKGLALTWVVLVGAGWDVCGSAAQARSTYELRNARIAAQFRVLNGELKIVQVEDLQNHSSLRQDEAFSLAFRDGSVVTASQMKIQSGPVAEPVTPVPTASRAAERIAGREICADLSARDGAVTAHWCAILREGTNYLRQEVTLKAWSQPAEISEVRMFDFDAPGAQVEGKVKGSPIVAGNFFFGFEYPLSVSEVRNGRATSILTRFLPLEPGNSITYSSVIGVSSPGQMRRDFLAYIENERAHPYRSLLHYNTWYDLRLGKGDTEAEALERVRDFGEELVRKRGVKMDSFLFDDGWDDPGTLWQFSSAYPDGFSKVHDVAEKYSFGIGVWMSPWGGYEQAKKERVAAGAKAGYETVNGGFALSAPKYYHLFESTCLKMITKYGVNQLKFDGTGNAGTVFPGSIFDSDFSAMIHLTQRLRQQEPDIFINLTTGTWPSPFWLRYTDSIWRGGDDYSFDGVGTWRQKWITYRDERTYGDIVLGGPLYPLNSLMLHGLIFGPMAKHLDTISDDDFLDDVHDYFGSGTDLQEMYITPSLLTQRDWDVLARAAKWSRANSSVLKDTHWIGGDPGKLEVYGWAAWTPEKGIITLRNPSDHAQEFSLDVDNVFQLPPDAARTYRARSPWAARQAQPVITLHAGQAKTIHLAPFQVLTLNATPMK